MKGETMKDLNPAELIIRDKAIQVVMTARGKNEFVEHRDALEQFKAVQQMGIDLGLTTPERVEQIKADAKRINNAYESR